MSASKFIIDHFGPRTESPVFLVSLANDKSQGKRLPPQELQTRDASEIEAFVARWDQPERALYQCVSTLKPNKRRNKENAAEIPGLHIDIDFKNVVESKEQIEAVLDHLPLLPQRLNFSGHGFHGYWWFPKGVPVTPDSTIRVEKALKRLAWALGGDEKVAHVAALMRVPGTHNTKFGAWVEVVTLVERNGAWSLEELEQWLWSIEQPLLHKKTDEKQKQDSDRNVWIEYGDQFGFSGRLDIDELFDNLQYFGAGGGGNVHETEIQVTASLLSRGEPVEHIIEYICSEIRSRIPESTKWNWQSEVRDIRQACVSWLVKHPELIELQNEMPDWLANNRLLKDITVKKSAPTVMIGLWHEELAARPRVELDWIVKDLILGRAVNGLFGDGGVGKDLLLMQLAIAMSCGTKWLGHSVKPGKVLYFPVEDDLDELRRRQHCIAAYLNINAAEHPKRFKIVPLLGKDTVLAVFDRTKVRSTKLFETVRNIIDEFRPNLTIVGNRVNIFGVNQNEDAQARQCMGLLNSLCVDFGTSVIMPSHASLGGMASGEGTSGSVQWNNACRLRLYLSRIKSEDGELNPNMRQLEVKKANWSATGKIISMHWEDGVFKADDVAVESSDQAEVTARMEQKEKMAEDEFMRMLAKYTTMKSRVSAQITARNSAPTVFSRDEQCRLRGKAGLRELRNAMNRLFERKMIHSVVYGPPSHLASHIEKVGLRVVK